MDESVYLELLAEDKRSIAYRPRFASLTNSALSAILLQQIIYWWKIKEKQPFFKFREPSSHKSYKPDDSWCEELSWNAYEFDTALKSIATKITKGIKKSDVMGGDVPTREENESDQAFYIRLEAALKRCVLYWTDSHRVTWYQVNEQILGKFVHRIYLDKSYGLRYLKYSILSDTRKNRKVKDTSNSETTAETTPETTNKEKDTPVAPAPALTIVPPKKIDPMFDAISEAWKTRAGARVGLVKGVLLGTAKKGAWKEANFDVPATPDEVKSFAAWYKRKNPNLSMPEQPDTIQKWFYQFRDAQKAAPAPAPVSDEEAPKPSMYGGYFHPKGEVAS